MAAAEGRRSFLQMCGQPLLYGPMLMCVGAALIRFSGKRRSRRRKEEEEEEGRGEEDMNLGRGYGRASRRSWRSGGKDVFLSNSIAFMY